MKDKWLMFAIVLYVTNVVGWAVFFIMKVKS